MHMCTLHKLLFMQSSAQTTVDGEEVSLYEARLDIELLNLVQLVTPHENTMLSSDLRERKHCFSLTASQNRGKML